MKRHVIALLLALAILFSLSATAGAAGFSDLEGHWAKSYIENLAGLGYINGYSDGTVRPEGKITTCEALALLARLYPLNEAALGFIHDDFGTFVENNIDPTLKWAYDEIEVCLASGILSEKELKNLRLTAPIGKETLAVLLVRAMRMRQEANDADPDSLTFADVEDITEQYRGHIAVLVDNGIITGDNQNNFAPKSSVTRAVVAAMLTRALEFNKDQNRTLRLEGYDAVEQYTGLITAAGNTSLGLRDTSGVNRIFELTDGVEITLNGEPALQSDAMCGRYASVRVRDKLVTGIAVQDKTTYLQGRLTNVKKETGGYIVQLKNLDTGTTDRCTVSNSTPVRIGGEIRDAAALRENQFATIAVKGRAATDVVVSTGSFDLSGTISTLAYGTPVVLEISDTEGGHFRFLLDLTALPAITRGGFSAGIDRLSIGDGVKLAIRNCELDSIEATSTDTRLEGTVLSISADTEGTVWVIQDSAGERHSLTVDPAAKAYLGSKSILPNTIQVGDTLSVATNGHSITEIQLKASSANTTGKVTGAVLAYDNKTAQLTVTNTTGRLVYIRLKRNGTVLNTATGMQMTLRTIEPNTQIVAYGNYTDATNFEATTIIIEG